MKTKLRDKIGALKLNSRALKKSTIKSMDLTAGIELINKRNFANPDEEEQEFKEDETIQNEMKENETDIRSFLYFPKRPLQRRFLAFSTVS